MNDFEPLDDLQLTLLPLDMYREIMGINPYVFWQLKCPYNMGDYPCNDIFLHYRWYGDRLISRQNILTAISMAEKRIADKLGYWVAPRYVEGEEVHTYPVKEFTEQPATYSLKLDWKNITSVGRRTLTLVAEDVNIVASYLPNNDVVTFSVTVTAGTLASQLIVCYANTQVEIRPVRVEVVGTTATFKVKKWLCGDPEVWGDPRAVPALPVGAALISVVDIYQVTIDTTNQVTLVWGTSNTCADPSYCGTVELGACVNEIHSPQGMIKYVPKGIIASQPGKALVNYTSGLQADWRGMRMYWAAPVAHFATTLLEVLGCDCSKADKIFTYWMEDMSETSPTKSYGLAPTHQMSAFGTKRGAVEAWDCVRSAMMD